jgi:cytochrome c oxidase subunit 4
MTPPTPTPDPSPRRQDEGARADLSDGKLAMVFAALLAVLATSAVLSRYLHGAIGTSAALALAAVKMGLIFWFFMRLRVQSGVVRLFAAAGFLWLAIFALLSSADYLTRG